MPASRQSKRIHALMSCQEPGSELSRLNRNAGNQVQRVDAHTYRVLEAALRMARMSEGAFKPCLASPARRKTPAANSAGWRDIELVDGNGVRCARPLRLDLGGIAKGYAVDLAVRTLQELGIDQIAVNAGGDLRIAGPQHRCIQLRDLQTPTRVAHSVALRNASIATSAAYWSRRLAHGREVSALIDSRTGEPYVGNISISVRAHECMTADALTKVVLFADAKIAERCLSACHAVAYVLSPSLSARVYPQTGTAQGSKLIETSSLTANDPYLDPWPLPPVFSQSLFACSPSKR